MHENRGRKKHDQKNLQHDEVWDNPAYPPQPGLALFFLERFYRVVFF
jgi:hypothetical protein